MTQSFKDWSFLLAESETKAPTTHFSNAQFDKVNWKYAAQPDTSHGVSDQRSVAKTFKEPKDQTITRGLNTYFSKKNKFKTQLFFFNICFTLTLKEASG